MAELWQGRAWVKTFLSAWDTKPSLDVSKPCLQHLEIEVQKKRVLPWVLVGPEEDMCEAQRREPGP